MDIVIVAASVCCDVVGINYSSFMIDSHHFSTHNPSERKLWLRALSNVKVKLQNRAPDPTPEELEYFRGEIRQYINTTQTIMDPRISKEALLKKACQRSMNVVGNGDEDVLPAAPTPEDFRISSSGVAHVTL